MTKEPKLEAAVRIVPEWQDYDQEIKMLYSRILEEASGTLVDQPHVVKKPDTQDHQPHDDL